MLHESLLLEILEERVSSSRGRHDPRAIKRKMSNYPTRHRQFIRRKRPRFSIAIH